MESAGTYDEHAPYARLMGLVKQLPQNSGQAGNDEFRMAAYLPHLVKGETNMILHGPTRMSPQQRSFWSSKLTITAASGKTTTMLVGIVERVQKHVNSQGRSLSSHSHPKALVIVPSCYLCRRTADLARFLAQGSGSQDITVLSAHDDDVVLKGECKNGADIIVTTPMMLTRIFQSVSIDWSETLILGLDDAERCMSYWIVQAFVCCGKLFQTCKNRVQIIATGRIVDRGLLEKANHERLCKDTVDVQSVSPSLNIPHGVHCVDSSQVSVRAGKAAEIVQSILKGAVSPKRLSPLITTVWATPARATTAANIFKDIMPHMDTDVVHSLDEDVTQSEVTLSRREFAVADATGFGTYEVLQGRPTDGENDSRPPLILIIHADMAHDTPETSSWHAWFKNTSRISGNGKNAGCLTFFNPRKQSDVIVATNLRDMLLHEEYRHVVPRGLSFLKDGPRRDAKKSDETSDDGAEEDGDGEDGFVLV
ncbi:uncharacterized protein BKCO1_200063 [Diplodia corticola]|uniref:DEAD/DEAH-box helicase domain-containing protein n=1 Tax=Diplodia corticola TaxID=236234 RepID=A0A1J9RGY0_9PEZI|nr:uncharacterized protein BKCO1_200063 [Diplodia corticola]OJD39856.1 hypothetical protein BKCO1_200063 [Diplodia corticola]